MLSAMSNAVCGVICVVEDGTLKGVITDGDVRRQLSEEDLGNVVGFTAADIMSTNPRVVDYNTRCRDADQIMIDCGVNSLVFKDSSGHFEIYNNLNR
ncbi:MAG TPA: hypothetical protein DD979_01515 [Gammaproteobacteria bacterium]|nr:hypothetical protein [Gammaproteobacteria bacterium]